MVVFREDKAVNLIKIRHLPYSYLAYPSILFMLKVTITFC